jgi:hypothetical protein
LNRNTIARWLNLTCSTSFGVYMNAGPSYTNLGWIGQSAGSAELIVFGRTMTEPVSAQHLPHARKHTWNTSYALVWCRFDPRAPRNKPWIHGPTKWLKQPSSLATHLRNTSQTVQGRHRWNGGRKGPRWSLAEHNWFSWTQLGPTQAQPPRTESYRPQEAIPTVQHSSRWNKWFGRSTCVWPSQPHSESISAFSYKYSQAP